MKEVTAILRPEKWAATREAIQAIGVEELIQHRVIGRGKQRGLRYLRRATDAGEGDMPYLPKRMVVCLVADESYTALLNAIIKVNQTGNVGDGKIFIRSLGVIQDIQPKADAEANATAVAQIPARIRT
ncbi:MAG: nitrogen fixation protein NifHD [Dehalococcoidia bacterium]|nr:nitrogen fixation protein NifHD [Dehalococcoidia bacterium]